MSTERYHDEGCPADRRYPRWTDSNCICKGEQHTNAAARPDQPMTAEQYARLFAHASRSTIAVEIEDGREMGAANNPEATTSVRILDLRAVLAEIESLRSQLEQAQRRNEELLLENIFGGGDDDGDLSEHDLKKHDALLRQRDITRRDLEQAQRERDEARAQVARLRKALVWIVERHKAVAYSTNTDRLGNFNSVAAHAEIAIAATEPGGDRGPLPRSFIGAMPDFPDPNEEPKP